MATVYILYSPSLKRFYTGVTGGDVADRLRKHLAHHSGFTAKASDWTVVHTETYPDKATAYKRERAIKAWKSRDMIERLVNHGRPPN